MRIKSDIMYKEMVKRFTEEVIGNHPIEYTTYILKPIDLTNNYRQWYTINLDMIVEEPSEYDPDSTIIQIFHVSLTTEYDMPIVVDKEDLETVLETLKVNNANISNEDEIRELLDRS